MAIVKCPHCKENTPDTTSNCINCGKDINSPPTNPPLFRDFESNKTSSSNNPFLKKLTYGMKATSIVGIVLSLIMIGVGVFFPRS